MSQLAPGRTSDIRLFEQMRRQTKDPIKKRKFDRHISLLMKEGEDSAIRSMRHRLVGATRANDQVEIENISNQLYYYSQRKGR